MSLLTKYPPESTDDLLLCADDRERFNSAIQQRHSVLLVGPPGLGKTASAHIYEKVAGLDAHFIDGTVQRGVDALNDAIMKGLTQTYDLKDRCIFIDEADSCSKDALEALRGPIMEKYGVPFILTANSLKKIPKAVQSRCERFIYDENDAEQMARLDQAQLDRGTAIASLEGSRLSREEIAIIFAGLGSDFRDKLRALDRAINNEHSGKAFEPRKSQERVPHEVGERAVATDVAVEHVETKGGPAPGDGAGSLDLPTLKRQTKRLLTELERTIDRYLFLPQGGSMLMALYIMHTHTYRSAKHSPILAITSLMKASGKSSCVKIIKALSCDAQSAIIPTGSQLFRAADAGGTLILDEADQYLQPRGDLVAVLNAGFDRDSPTVKRYDQEFEVFCPKVIARIGRITPDTTESRCITIRLTPAQDERSDIEPEDFDALRGQLEDWAQQAFDYLEAARPKLPQGFSGRKGDKYRHILAIADLADLGAEGRKAAKSIEDMHVEEIDESWQLLSDIVAIFDVKGVAKLQTKILVDALRAMPDRRWSSKLQISDDLGRFLAPCGIRTHNVRGGGKQAKGYHLDEIKHVLDAHSPKSGK